MRRAINNPDLTKQYEYTTPLSYGPDPHARAARNFLHFQLCEGKVLKHRVGTTQGEVSPQKY